MDYMLIFTLRADQNIIEINQDKYAKVISEDIIH